ncbi:AAA family ATPase [Streptomyces sp. NPDC001520]|uniref:AAA family ATPase n=1 Tax=Streptomyces sp. NPDC001520 TaxID=3364581 RepID=UPI0036A64DCD
MTDDIPLRQLLNDRLTVPLTASGLTLEAADLLRGMLPEPSPEKTGRAGPVYLRSITAAGWRGVGPETTLDLPPGPGLTVVEGSNGTGKSSFAEAAEMALTGLNTRWDGSNGKARTAVWREGWRNCTTAQSRPSPCGSPWMTQATRSPCAARGTG